MKKSDDKPKNVIDDEAVLSHEGTFTSFEYNGFVIRFKTPSQLERYTRILKWDNGYIVVMANYGALGEMEDYIDLIPILENLYIQSSEFLKPIKKVRINYGER